MTALLTKSAFRKECISHVGKRYILGADGPTAFDCSGFVLYCWRKIGMKIGDMTAQGIWGVTKSVSSPKVGDAVFLANHKTRKAPAGFKYGIGHVAIITAKLSNGDWEIVEARGVKAGVVRTTLSYWKKRAYYAGIRRHPSFALLADALPVEPVVTPTPVTGIPAILSLDGNPGPKTYAALQWSLGIPQTGLFDAATRKALGIWLGTSSDSTISGADVYRLQKWVDVVADKDWGEKTSVALQRWLNALIVAANSPSGVGGQYEFEFGFFNGQDPRFGGSKDFAGRAKKIRALMPGVSMISGTETTRDMREAIAKEMGSSWWPLVEDSGSVCLLVNLAEWTPPKPSSVTQKPFGDKYHGAICGRYVCRWNGTPLDAISTHTRPKSVASAAQKKADVNRAAGLAGTTDALLAGDFAMDADSLLSGWSRISPDADTMDASGDQHVDAAYKKGARLKKIRAGVILDPGSLSDHKWGKIYVALAPST